MEPVDEIVWEDPPEKGARVGLAGRVAQQLRTRPGTWAKVLGPTSESKIESMRVMLIQGGRSGIVHGEFETRRKKTVSNDDLSFCLWARFVGDNGSEAVG